MRCVEQLPTGRPCIRDAVAIVTVGQLLAPMCGDCVIRAAQRLAGLVVRALRRPAPGRPRPVIALTCTT